MIMNFLKKNRHGQVYQKRTLIVTQAHNVSIQRNNINMKINRLRNANPLKQQSAATKTPGYTLIITYSVKNHKKFICRQYMINQSLDNIDDQP